ncbi:flagellar hook-associated protein FlgK [uncultured Clostridium sp.]|jgi:flagellar hook-associated protein 1 FlgK|uniref:flagellar hook-associated protein FlgK n=1 Tax=uncultured Clostridium sp. TaxID=59620 RepID=UPI0025DF2E0D|nr:flagellar hook-associated protein FlgK [uncultured Clostridium sp.]
MSGLLSTLNTAKSGMNVSQVAIQTTSHNISNINTPGYSRQRVNQSASSPYSMPGKNSSFGAGQIGTGAQIDDVTRIRNSFYDYQYRSESHQYGSTSVKYEYFKNIEGIFNEPSDTAISSSLNSFFNSWSELSKDPQSSGVKSVVIENGKYLSNSINSAFKRLESLEEGLDKQSEYIMDEVNSMLSQLDKLEKNIKIIQGSGKSPNDFLDQRDQLLDNLSFKLNINDKDVKATLKKAYDTNGKVTLDDLTKSGVKISGELEGTLSMKKEINKYKDGLKQLANTITSNVNDAAGQDIFKAKDGELISINPEMLQEPEKINVTADIALKVYELKSEKVNINGKDMTINTFYNSMIQDLGQSSAAVIRDESNQSKLLENIDSSRSSVSGVSLDEEMISLVQLQHTYSANAKVMSTIDSLLDVVVNGLVR